MIDLDGDGIGPVALAAGLILLDMVALGLFLLAWWAA